jgi:succinate dehydrogenase / fumarate reductase, cytochrome b subunit
LATTVTPPLYRTTIGKKVLVAVSGLIGIGFVFAHMLGNLHAFQGPNQINSYAEELRNIGEPLVPRSLLLWLLRLTVIAAVTVHVTVTTQLALRSRASRKSRYTDADIVQASYASRTMRWGGAAILAFIVFHLMDFTWGVHPDYVRGDVYHNLITGFNRWPVVVIYLVAMLCLGMHLYHGTWSTFQTLGLTRARWRPLIRRLALTIALVISVGYAIVPLGVAFNVIK